MEKILLLIFLIITQVYCDSHVRVIRQTTCGVTSHDTGLIIGGQGVQKGEYPWIAALMQADEFNQPQYFCGGILVSSTKVLSAAHCIQEKHQGQRKLERDIKIYLGIHDLTNQLEDRLILSPEKIYIHPSWNPFITKYNGDISILSLEQSIQFTRNILPICIWDFDFEPKLTVGTVVGYGKSENQSIRHENLPRKLEVPILPVTECIYQDPKFAQITSETTICAGAGDGRGPCTGDSGGGLYFKYNNKFYLLGIVSASFVEDGHCDVTKFALYTNVLKYKDWIYNPSEHYESEQNQQSGQQGPQQNRHQSAYNNQQFNPNNQQYYQNYPGHPQRPLNNIQRRPQEEFYYNNRPIPQENLFGSSFGQFPFFGEFLTTPREHHDREEHHHKEHHHGHKHHHSGERNEGHHHKKKHHSGEHHSGERG